MATGHIDIRSDLTAYHLHPSAGDVTSNAGDGRLAREKILTELLAALHNDAGWVLSGFDYNSGSGLTATFNAGEAVIDGKRFFGTGTFDVALEDDATNHIWLSFQETNDQAQDMTVYVATSDSPPSEPSVKIATVTTSSGTIDSNTDERETSHPLDLSSVLTAKGDIFVRTSNGIVRLPVGADDDILKADSGQTEGVKWAAAPGGGGTFFMEAFPLGTGNTGDAVYKVIGATPGPAWISISSSGGAAAMQDKMPDDFSTIDTAVLVMAASDLSEPMLDFGTRFQAEFDDAFTGGTTETDNNNNTWYSAASAAYEIIFYDVSDLFDFVAAGDAISCLVDFNSGSNVAYVLGLFIKYS